VDLYELHNYNHLYSFKHWGTSNLELPLAALPRTGSALLLTVKPITRDRGAKVEISVPLHGRYGDVASSNSPSYQSVQVPSPEGFFACPSSSISSISDQKYLPNMPNEFTTLFNSSALRVIPVSEANTSAGAIRIPVGNSRDIGRVEFGTAFTIILSFLYLIYMSFKTASRIHRRAKEE